MNYRDFLQKVIYMLINPIIKAMIKIGITPNIVTFIGFIGNMIAAAFFVDAAWTLRYVELYSNPIIDEYNPFVYQDCMTEIGWGGFIILAAGLFDMMDGRLARMSDKSSNFGALWDSTLDRCSELVSLFGICLVFIRLDGDKWMWMSLVTFIAMMSSLMVSYIRARVEGLGFECKVGLMQRPERVVVTAVTAMLTGITDEIWWLAGGMILIAALAGLTAIWRLAYSYKEMNEENNL